MDKEAFLVCIVVGGAAVGLGVIALLGYLFGMFPDTDTKDS